MRTLCVFKYEVGISSLIYITKPEYLQLPQQILYKRWHIVNTHIGLHFQLPTLNFNLALPLLPRFAEDHEDRITNEVGIIHFPCKIDVRTIIVKDVRCGIWITRSNISR